MQHEHGNQGEDYQHQYSGDPEDAFPQGKTYVIYRIFPATIAFQKDAEGNIITDENPPPTEPKA